METHHFTAIDMLARGLPADFVAKKLNVSERTVRRWKVMPEFAEELRLSVETFRFALGVRYDRIVGKCQVLTDEALEKIAQLMRTSHDPRVCLSAANTLLNHCSRMAARSRELEKTDKNGRTSADVPLEPAPQKRTSPAPVNLQPQPAQYIAPSNPVSATGHASGHGRSGAAAATTASIHPRPVDSGAQKADVNGHVIAAADPELQALRVHRAYRERIAASKAPQKADKNGHFSLEV